MATEAMDIAPDNATESLPDEKIIDDGDLLINCCDSSGGKFLVSAAVVKRASPVFKAMLGPHFKEGRSRTLPLEVECPEDDWDGMRLMLQLLHNCQSCADKESLSVEDAECFVEMAVLADKYQCIQALSLQADAVLLKVSSRRSSFMRVTYCCVVAAYLLNKPKHFYVFTKRLALGYTDTFSKIIERYSPGIGDVLGIRLIFELESQRTAAILKVSEDIRDMGVRECPQSDCDEALYSTEFLGNLCDELSEAVNWPPSFSINSVTRVLRETVAAGDIAMGEYPCGHGPTNAHRWRYEFRSFAKEVYDNAGGMCIDCVKKGCYKTGVCKETGHATFIQGSECEL